METYMILRDLAIIVVIALALSTLKVLRGQATALTYSGKPVWQGFEGISF